MERLSVKFNRSPPGSLWRIPHVGYDLALSLGSIILTHNAFGIVAIGLEPVPVALGGLH